MTDYVSYFDAEMNMDNSGPGLDGYAFQADTYCPGCAESILAQLADSFPLPWHDYQDSENVPQPIFFGEADTAQHCADCGAYLYGPDPDYSKERDPDPYRHLLGART